MFLCHNLSMQPFLLQLVSFQHTFLVNPVPLHYPFPIVTVLFAEMPCLTNLVMRMEIAQKKTLKSREEVDLLFVRLQSNRMDTESFTSCNQSKDVEFNYGIDVSLKHHFQCKYSRGPLLHPKFPIESQRFSYSCMRSHNKLVP